MGKIDRDAVEAHGPTSLKNKMANKKNLVSNKLEDQAQRLRLDPNLHMCTLVHTPSHTDVNANMHTQIHTNYVYNIIRLPYRKIHTQHIYHMCKVI